MPVAKQLHDYGALQMQPINIRVPDSDLSALQKIADDTGVTLSDVGREAIARYLNRSGAGQRTKARLDRLEDQVNRLTLMMMQPKADRTEMAAQFLQIIDKHY